MGEQNDLRFRMPPEQDPEVVCIDGLAPLELEADHVGAVGRGQSGKAFAEVSTQRGDDLVTG